MNYEEFRDTICSRLGEAFPMNTSIESQVITKSNDSKLDAFIINLPDSSLSPTIYPRSLFDMYESGHDVDDIISNIVKNYSSTIEKSTAFVNRISDPDYIRSRVTMRLVKSSMNTDFLSDLASIPYLDLSIVFYVILDQDPDTVGGFYVKSLQADEWGLDADSLYSLAMENTPKLLPLKKCTIVDILQRQMKDTGCDIGQILDFDPGEDIPMYIMTNENYLYGASTLLYPDALKTYAKEIKKDLIVLPSSVHEVILTPYSKRFTDEFLSDMISCGNETLSEPGEILSDHHYIFRRKTGKLSMPD